jgi:hypothetical protein
MLVSTTTKIRRNSMRRNLIPQLAVFAAAAALALSSAAYARDNGGRDRGNRDRSDRNSTFIWKHHENGCAVGNRPPPGANCTNRDDQQQ